MSRKPDYRVAAMNKRTDEKGTVGSAWVNENGTISITINGFVHIEGSKDLLITLFPNDDAKQEQK
jgi:hypothetical protein